MATYSKNILTEAHKHSSLHEAEIKDSSICGCFYCFHTFEPDYILDWVDEDNAVGATALCPKCGIDSVIGNKSEYPVDEKLFLNEMHQYWFERSVWLKPT